MNRVFIKTYGCQMNERDSEAVAALLRGRGYIIAPDEHQADIILLNTCAVRDQAEQKAIGKAGYLMNRKKKKQPKLKVGIMGCMAQNRGLDLIDTLPDLDLLVGTQKFHRVPDMLDNLRDENSVLSPKPSTLIDLEEEEGSQNEIRLHLKEKGLQPSAFVSIMQGCNMRCAFCIVPKTRGTERCRPIASIVQETEELVANGTKEVTLLGQIVTSYGRGEIEMVNGKSAFVQLLEALSEIDGLERIRFTSPHPRGFRQDLVDAYGYLPKLMPQVPLPLQSGSDRILKAMKRPYSSERFLEIVASLKTVKPDMFFSTDIIVGFPGETDEDFEMTRKLFDHVEFDMGFIFKYSPRSGTVSAEEMEDNVPSEVKEERNQILLKRLAIHSEKRNRGLIGSTQQVLIEGKARRGESMYTGRTPGNRKLVFKANERLVGQIVPVRVTDAGTSALMGELVIQE